MSVDDAGGEAQRERTFGLEMRMPMFSCSSSRSSSSSAASSAGSAGASCQLAAQAGLDSTACAPSSEPLRRLRLLSPLPAAASLPSPPAPSPSARRCFLRFFLWRLRRADSSSSTMKSVGESAGERVMRTRRRGRGRGRGTQGLTLADCALLLRVCGVLLGAVAGAGRARAEVDALVVVRVGLGRAFVVAGLEGLAGCGRVRVTHGRGRVRARESERGAAVQRCDGGKGQK